MRVVILGTGTALPVKGRGYAAIYVRVGGEHLLLDAGPGTLRQLARVGVTYLDLDRVVLTHAHPDHCLDLVSILFAMRIPQPARTKPLMIYGPRGLRRLYRQLNAAFHGWLEPRTYRLTLREVGNATLHCRRYTLRTALMNHSTPALGVRLEANGRRVVYSGDTDVCEAIVWLGRQADLLILECSMPDARKVGGHLTPTECGRIAAAAGCRRLLLTHCYPMVRPRQALQAVRRSYRGPVRFARDFQRIAL